MQPAEKDYYKDLYNGVKVVVVVRLFAALPSFNFCCRVTLVLANLRSSLVTSTRALTLTTWQPSGTLV